MEPCSEENKQCKKVPNKLVNDPKYCVVDALTGFALANANVKLLEGCNVVLRSDLLDFKCQGKVALVTGGGSGHEPFCIGYVGKGLLTASVAGDVFAAPSTAAITKTINNCYTDAGLLLIVVNYTGDRLAFGKAAEIAKLEDKHIEMVIVGEDCALTSKDKSAGRRGLCGTVFIHKMGGAMAEEGISLREIKVFLEDAAKEMGTISVSLSSCSIPGKPAGFEIADDMLEFGLGIHGEAGVAAIEINYVSSIVARMIDHMLNSGYLPSMIEKEVALIVNNLGGTSQMELSVVAKEALMYLDARKLFVKRCYVGTFVTSLEMAGVSLSVMILNKERLKYLDAYCDSSVWPKSGITNQSNDLTIPCIDIPKDLEHYDEKPEGFGALLYRYTKEICESFVANEEYLNELDRAAGDGDTGTTFATCARSILCKLTNEAHVELPINDAHKYLIAVASEVEKTMGGSSGGLVSIFLTAAASEVKIRGGKEDFINALHLGICAVEKYGGAEEGDRTMLDALHPVLRALKTSVMETSRYFDMAARAARDGANATLKMNARAGRASYVSSQHLVSIDPGAAAVAIAFEAMAKVEQSDDLGDTRK